MPSPELDPLRMRQGHGAKWTAVPPDVLPAWVADMDLGVPGPVRDRLVATLDRGDLGYPYWTGEDPVVEAFAGRMQARYGWEPTPGRTRVMSDLIQILQVVIEHTTQPGEAVALHVPSYPPFLASIARAGREITALPVRRSAEAWEFDLDNMRRLMAEHRPRLLVLVNPHNPTGRVMTRDELLAVADLAVSFQIPVLSDEIHADLTYAPATHVPFASLSPEVADLTITTTSPGKAFNIAGMRCAVAHFGHKTTAELLDKAPLDYFGTPSVLSRIAAVAAWDESSAWLGETMKLLAVNRDLVEAWASGRPDVDASPQEATYLAWLDFANSQIAHDPAGAILERGLVQLSPGPEFSQHTDVRTDTFARLNYATHTTTLQEILKRIGTALDGHR